MKFLALVFSNLKRRKLRTTLTLLSILVAFLLFGFLCAIKEAFTAGVTLAGVDRLITRHKVSLIQSLPLSYEQRIAAIPGVAATAHQSWFGGIYQDPKNFFASIPVEPEKFLAMYPEFVLPAAQKEAWMKTRNGAVVGRGLVKKFQWKIGDHIPLTCPIWGEPANQPNWDFEVVGIYDGAKKGTDTSGLYFRYDYFDEARTRGKGEIGWVGVLTGVLAIAEGFRSVMTASGTPDVAVVLRSGADSEMTSGLSREEVRTISDAPGVARNASGPVTSAEMFVIIDLPKRSTGTGANVPLRGVDPPASASSAASSPPSAPPASPSPRPCGKHELNTHRFFVVVGSLLASGKTSR